MARILVSQCLLGCFCRYDAQLKTNQKVLALAKEHVLIPVCPEQMGGLPTPRTPSERVGNQVLMKDGTDVTENYRRGAENALRIAELNRVDYAILKDSSPSCGCGRIYDGTFSGRKIPGDGVLTELLKKNGYTVYNDEEI